MPPVEAYSKRWLELFTTYGDGWKKSTEQNYRSILDNHILPVWGDWRLSREKKAARRGRARSSRGYWSLRACPLI